MGTIKQRTAYWVDMYRCMPPNFVDYNIDSYIAFIEIGVDSNSRRVGERPPPLGWSEAGEISYVMDDGTIVVKPVTKRARGGIYVEPGVPVNQVKKLLDDYRFNIAPKPAFPYDADCTSSSGEEISSEQASPIASSFTPFVSSGIAELSSLEEISSEYIESSPLEFSSADAEISSEVQEISSEVPEISSAPQEISSGVPEISSAAEVSSALYESSSVDLCAVLGCPGGQYGETTGTGATEQDSIDDFFSSASANCDLALEDLCVGEVLSTQEFLPGLWIAQGRYCCLEGILVDLFPTLVINTDAGTSSYPLIPGNNPIPVDQEASLIEFSLEGSSSSGTLDFDLPNTVTAIIFRGEWPKRECLVDNVSTLEIFGEFSDPGTTSAILTYRELFSDLLAGGQPYFHNPNAGLASLERLDSIVIQVDNCETSSSSGEV
jgi:hypothetical protein